MEGIRFMHLMILFDLPTKMEQDRKRANAFRKFLIQDGINELLEAINDHVFDQVGNNKNFFGNYEINYPILNE